MIPSYNNHTIEVNIHISHLGGWVGSMEVRVGKKLAMKEKNWSKVNDQIFDYGRKLVNVK
jgi:hypothetical protein